MFEKIISKVKKFFNRNKFDDSLNENEKDESTRITDEKDNATLSKVSGGRRSYRQEEQEEKKLF